jgi:hypothetical protein
MASTVMKRLDFLQARNDCIIIIKLNTDAPGLVTRQWQSAFPLKVALPIACNRQETVQEGIFASIDKSERSNQ